MEALEDKSRNERMCVIWDCWGAALVILLL